MAAAYTHTIRVGLPRGPRVEAALAAYGVEEPVALKGGVLTPTNEDEKTFGVRPKLRCALKRFRPVSVDGHPGGPLFAVKVKGWAPGRPHVLITGGVHGYETSGVQGAILFLKTEAVKYSAKFNILVAPCVSPWGYETIQRWNYQATDPNRSFNPDGEVVPGRSFNPEPATDESRNLIAYLKTLNVDKWLCHIDQHEVRP